MTAAPGRRAGWFVTGTDTGVGKTVVAAALCRLRADLGHEVVYVKPVQSGAADGDDDAATVRALADVPTMVGAVLGPSLAPGVALREAGAELAAEDLCAVVADAASRYPTAELVVEGAGGLLVELGSDGTTCADLAGALGLPLLVAARAGLGTLNHTALTLEAALGRRLPISGVVVSGYPPVASLAARTNLIELQRGSGCLVGCLPMLDLTLPQTAMAEAANHLGPQLGGPWAPPRAKPVDETTRKASP